MILTSQTGFTRMSGDCDHWYVQSPNTQKYHFNCDFYDFCQHKFLIHF